MSSTRTVNTAAASREIATRQDASPVEMTMRDIAAMQPAFQMVLPSSIPAERMVRVLQTVVRQNPDLANPAPQFRAALLGAAMTCAQLGLDPTPAIGHAYIYPMGGKPTFVLGFRGAIYLAADSGIHLKAWAIHEHDTYDVQLGTDAHLEHRLPPFGTDRGRPVAYYAVASFTDGSAPLFEVMTAAEVEVIRQASPGKNSPAWRGHYDEMAKKTVIKRLAKNLPIGVKLAEAAAHDGHARVDVQPEALAAAPDFGGDDVADAELVEPDFDPESGEQIPAGAGR